MKLKLIYLSAINSWTQTVQSTLLGVPDIPVSKIPGPTSPEKNTLVKEKKMPFHQMINAKDETRTTNLCSSATLWDKHHFQGLL